MCPSTKNIPTLINDSRSGEEIVTGCFLKAGQGSKTGITVARRKSDDAIIITRIQPGTMASTTALKPGMRLLGVNDTPITAHMSGQEAAELLMNASGMVKVMASHGVAGALYKESSQVKTGISVGQTTTGKIFISKIAPNSLAALNAPQLKQGMPIESINNVPIKGLSCRQAADLLMNAVGVVTIAARHDERIIC